MAILETYAYIASPIVICIAVLIMNFATGRRRQKQAKQPLATTQLPDNVVDIDEYRRTHSTGHMFNQRSRT